MWHAKESSLLNGHECRAYVKICSPSPAMVLSPYEWEIVEWDNKPLTKKQTNRETNKQILNLFVYWKFDDSYKCTKVQLHFHLRTIPCDNYLQTVYAIYNTLYQIILSRAKLFTFKLNVSDFVSSEWLTMTFILFRIILFTNGTRHYIIIM